MNLAVDAEFLYFLRGLFQSDADPQMILNLVKQNAKPWQANGQVLVDSVAADKTTSAPVQPQLSGIELLAFHLVSLSRIFRMS